MSLSSRIGRKKWKTKIIMNNFNSNRGGKYKWNLLGKLLFRHMRRMFSRRRVWSRIWRKLPSNSKRKGKSWKKKLFKIKRKLLKKLLKIDKMLPLKGKKLSKRIKKLQKKTNNKEREFLKKRKNRKKLKCRRKNNSFNKLNNSKRKSKSNQNKIFNMLAWVSLRRWICNSWEKD